LISDSLEGKELWTLSWQKESPCYLKSKGQKLNSVPTEKGPQDMASESAIAASSSPEHPLVQVLGPS
jgi:hypothetical protein